MYFLVHYKGMNFLMMLLLLIVVVFGNTCCVEKIIIGEATISVM